MVLVSATSGVRGITLLMKVFFFTGEEYIEVKIFLEGCLTRQLKKHLII